MTVDPGAATTLRLDEPQIHSLTFLRPTTERRSGLIESHGNDITEAEQVVTATAADEALAAHLGCAAGIPILHIERTYLGRRGEVLEHAVSDFLPQHYSLRSRLGRSLAPDPSPVLLQE